MKVLLLGAGGMLGSEIARAAPPWARLTAVDRRRLDVRDAEAVAAMIDRCAPTVVINATGYTGVDAAESESRGAFDVNATAVAALAGHCAARGIHVVHFGTDYVFAGDRRTPYGEDDPPAPVGAYARSKLAGETALRESGAPHLVIRTQWLFGLHGQSFPRTMWERARSGQPTRVVNDQVGRPTYAVDLAAVIWRLIHRGAEGTVHAANDGAATWYDVARRVFEAVDAGHLLTPCRTADYPTAAVRPAYSVLETSRVEAMLSERMPHWHDGLDRFLRELCSEAGVDTALAGR
ncbi:MAG: dTDP-4-dehydrorhamnose reductase [Gemmatimonadaceae bacterium]